MAPFYWWGSLLFTTKFPEIPRTHFIDLLRMKGWVDLGATQLFSSRCYYFSYQYFFCISTIRYTEVTLHYCCLLFWKVCFTFNVHYIQGVLIFTDKISQRSWNTGLVSSRVSLTSLGEGVCYALGGHPYSHGIIIKILHGVVVLLHQPVFHSIFSYWVC